MSNPFPLSATDESAFVNDVGWEALGSLPDWGGIIVWRGRSVLVFPKTNGTYAFTDITDGIPAGSTTIPVSLLIENVPKTQTSTFGVFLYSLPQNFYAVAVEKAKTLASDAGEVIQPLIPGLGLTAIIVIGILIYLYAPRTR